MTREQRIDAAVSRMTEAERMKDRTAIDRIFAAALRQTREQRIDAAVRASMTARRMRWAVAAGVTAHDLGWLFKHELIAIRAHFAVQAAS